MFRYGFSFNSAENIFNKEQVNVKRGRKTTIKNDLIHY